MDEATDYRERYCALLDILGFRALVQSVEQDSQTFNDCRNLLGRVHDACRLGTGEVVVTAQSISDAVALSTSVTPVGLATLLAVIKELYIDLLCQGYFMRGAVVRGKLFHEGQTMFGAALLTKSESRYANLTTEEKATLARYRGIKDILREQFADSMDNPRHFEKVRWVAEYWNAEISSRFALRVHGAGLDVRLGI